MLKQSYFKQFNINMQFSSVLAIDRTVSGATTPSQSRSGSDGNKGVFHIPQSSSITGASPADFFSVLQRCSQFIQLIGQVTIQKLHSPKLQHYWSFTSRFFSVLQRCSQFIQLIGQVTMSKLSSKLCKIEKNTNIFIRYIDKNYMKIS